MSIIGRTVATNYGVDGVVVFAGIAVNQVAFPDGTTTQSTIVGLLELADGTLATVDLSTCRTNREAAPAAAEGVAAAAAADKIAEALAAAVTMSLSDADGNEIGRATWRPGGDHSFMVPWACSLRSAELLNRGGKVVARIRPEGLTMVPAGTRVVIKVDSTSRIEVVQ